VTITVKANYSSSSLLTKLQNYASPNQLENWNS